MVAVKLKLVQIEVVDRNSILRTNRRNICFHTILRIGNRFMVENLSGVKLFFPLKASLQQLIILWAAMKQFGNNL